MLLERASLSLLVPPFPYYVFTPVGFERAHGAAPLDTFGTPFLQHALPPNSQYPWATFSEDRLPAPGTHIEMNLSVLEFTTVEAPVPGLRVTTVRAKAHCKSSLWDQPAGTLPAITPSMALPLSCPAPPSLPVSPGSAAFLNHLHTNPHLGVQAGLLRRSDPGSLPEEICEGPLRRAESWTGCLGEGKGKRKLIRFRIATPLPFLTS